MPYGRDSRVLQCKVKNIVEIANEIIFILEQNQNECPIFTKSILVYGINNTPNNGICIFQ